MSGLLYICLPEIIPGYLANAKPANKKLTYNSYNNGIKRHQQMPFS